MEIEKAENKSLNIKYYIAIGFMLLFIFNDLLFDFCFSFQSSDHIALGFTILSAIIVFFCTGKIKNDEVKNQYYTATKFIKSNFDNAQVIFSILDIICGIISILSSYFFLSCAFKIVKVFYIPTKILVVVNKEKSLIKPITKFSYLWTGMRLLEKKGGNMANFIKSNKQTLLFGFLVSALCGVSTYFALPLFFGFAKWILILISVAIFFIAYGLVFIVGKDTVESLALRLSKKVLPPDKYNEIISTYNNAIQEVNNAKADAELKQKVQAEAKKRLLAEQKEAEKKEKEAKANEKNAETQEFEKLVEAELQKLKSN